MDEVQSTGEFAAEPAGCVRHDVQIGVGLRLPHVGEEAED
jgi:hypothetical protein